MRRLFGAVFIQKREEVSWRMNLRPSLQVENIRFVKHFFKKVFREKNTNSYRI